MGKKKKKTQENPPWPILGELEVFKYHLEQMFLKEPMQDHSVELEAPSIPGLPRKLGPQEEMNLPRVSHALAAEEGVPISPTP